MKIILLIFLVIPVFIFQSFIFVDAVNAIRIPEKKAPANSGTIRFNSEKVSKKANLRVLR